MISTVFFFFFVSINLFKLHKQCNINVIYFLCNIYFHLDEIGLYFYILFKVECLVSHKQLIVTCNSGFVIQNVNVVFSSLCYFLFYFFNCLMSNSLIFFINFFFLILTHLFLFLWSLDTEQSDL